MNISAVLRVMRDRRTVFCATALVVTIMFIGSIGAYDLWWHLKAGENILRTGNIPHEDPFSFTAAGRPWTYHSWLSGIILHVTHKWAGQGGLIVLRAMLMAGSLMISWVAARRRGVGAGLASILVLAACFQLQTRALMRPYLFSFVLFSVFYLLVQQTFEHGTPSSATVTRSRFGGVKWFLWGGGGRLILLPCLMVLWANLHAGFLVGLLIIGAFGAGEMVAVAVQKSDKSHYLRALLAERYGARFRALLLTGVLCLVAGVITPYGPGALLYPFRLVAEVKLVREVQEWQAMPLSGTFAVFWVLLALTVAALARSAYLCSRSTGLRQKAGQFCADAFLLAGFGLLAGRSVRNLAWVMLLVPPVLGYHFVATRHAVRKNKSKDEADREEEPFYVFVSYALGLVLALYHVMGGGGFGFGVSEDRFPVRAGDYLARAPLKGRFYNEYSWGGYLIWRFWPQRRVFIDGRCLVYGDAVIGEALAVAKGQGAWQEILEKYKVEGLLIRYRLRDSTHFFRSGKWHCVYWDDTALVAVGEAVRQASPQGLEYFPLSNPAVFRETFESASPARILEEVDHVLEWAPDCWTAWTFRARCLLKMAEEDTEGRADLFKQALEAAHRAVEINDIQPETWQALGQCYEALGHSKQATRAFRKANSLKP